MVHRDIIEKEQDKAFKVQLMNEAILYKRINKLRKSQEKLTLFM
jgi:hypothetical protein